MGGHSWNAVSAFLFSICGGLARQFYEESKNPKKRKTMSQLIKDLYVSFFCGVMAWSLVMANHVTGYWVDLICGTVGWTSPNLMHGFTKVFDAILNNIVPVIVEAILKKLLAIINAVFGNKDKD